jgi:hypothetical protein
MTKFLGEGGVEKHLKKIVDGKNGSTNRGFFR